MKRLTLGFLILLFSIVIASPATTIAVNDSAVSFGLSKMNWVQSGSSYIFTANPGAYLKLKFTGTSFATVFDLTAINATGTGSVTYPTIRWSVDGGSKTTRQLLSSDTSVSMGSGLVDTTHTLLLEFIATDVTGGTNRWNQIMGIKVTSFTVDTGKSVANASLLPGLILCLGDSITEGAYATAAQGNPPYAPQVQDATVGYQQLLVNAFGMEYSNVAFSGQQLGGGASFSQVPGLINTYNLIQQGVTRTFSPNISAVTINIGTNSGASAADARVLLEGVRAAVGASTSINFIIPFGQYNATNLTNGYNDYVAAHPLDLAITKIDLGSAGATIVTNNSYDAVHPNTAGHALLEAALLPFVILSNGDSPLSRPGSAALIFADVTPFPAVAKREDEDELIAA